MEKFRRLEAIAASLPLANVDTDVIIRVDRCARTPRAELGRYAFEALRYVPDGSENPDFVLNREPWRRARILVCGENFGCGSSREMAVWAIAGDGHTLSRRALLRRHLLRNCLQNGVLAIRLPASTVARLHALAARAGDRDPDRGPRAAVDPHRRGRGNFLRGRAARAPNAP
ncbi:MAG: hypothetical protein RML56_10765 [Burkholderiales bacterium]|nr:hypothetical protein [Burkholderiales bacterium]